ncbi:hypothetical protein [Stenotrophomonas acidaminiphila]|uniref:hypothetical protein n=1 Tax=Stenotrophomonas acidaminiphila TaxID=128780 RepID=UPI0028A6794D|nr:hypothetical protein [Stenotrophomonas acidaminiphila]
MQETENEASSLRARAVEILARSLRDSYVEIRGANEVEASIAAEAESLIVFLRGSDSRTFCILAASFLEDVLRRSLINYWSLKSKKSQQDYFGSNGPLSTFSQRILVCVGLGWISQEQGINASRLRRIRNEFAHNHLIHELADRRISGLVESLRPYEKTWLKMSEYASAYGALNLEETLRMRFFCNAFQIAGSVLARAKLLGVGIPAGFRPSGGFDNLTEIEQRFGNYMIRFCFDAAGVPLSD